MADPASNYQRGAMDIAEQSSTFALFMGMTKWGSLGTAVLLLFLVLMFATGAGFIGATAASVVASVVGVVLLREKPQAAH